MTPEQAETIMKLLGHALFLLWLIFLAVCMCALFLGALLNK